MNLLDDNFTENEDALYSLINNKASKLFKNNIKSSKLELVDIVKQEFVFNGDKPITADALLKVIEKWANNSVF
ncbi:MAG: hypothetical protein KBT69_02330 [Oceanihabitans sp.]|nr:hypothetical protein [Oceanihabitans sp.]